MSARTRILELLPVLVVFALVSAFATFVVIEYVVHEPLVVPPPQVTPADELPHPAPADDGATLVAAP